MRVALPCIPKYGREFSSSTRTKSVTERYGRISDKALITAIDQTTFDHGETEIWLAKTK